MEIYSLTYSTPRGLIIQIRPIQSIRFMQHPMAKMLKLLGFTIKIRTPNRIQHFVWINTKTPFIGMIITFARFITSETIRNH